MENKYIIGIDTSNYTSSVALTDIEGNIIIDKRKLLEVPKGKRGLRQQEAVFQHIHNLPLLLKEVLSLEILGNNPADRIMAIAASERPRPVTGSYMPVFESGKSAAQILSAALDVATRFYSHQEGHIRAGMVGSPLKPSDTFIAFHLSGGTSEVLLYSEEKIEKLGGSLDISLGQLVDRLGVKAGMSFPAGAELDKIAYNYYNNGRRPVNNLIPKVKLKGYSFNLSGPETYSLRKLEDKGQDFEKLVFMVFERIAILLADLIEKLNKEKGARAFLMVGGIASSRTLRKLMKDKIGNELALYFAESGLSSDNAVGISLLGGDHICL